TVELPAPHTSCPAFGGPDLQTLFCTTAQQGRTKPTKLDGASFAAPVPVRGLAEHRVHLDL
ncbi:SMP-30/gluconolactonase/LRE family protein, partial [Roseibaca sp. V10]|nr:SMP-30/gluconolactonase/LRE family protein [Roseibaca domitiana]